MRAQGRVPEPRFGRALSRWNFSAGQQLAKFRTCDLPVGSKFVLAADKKGAAVYEASFGPCLQRTTPQLMAGLAIAYHSDGESRGHETCPMGNKSLVRLFAVFPPAAETTNQVCSNAKCNAGARCRSGDFNSGIL